MRVTWILGVITGEEKSGWHNPVFGATSYEGRIRRGRMRVIDWAKTARKDRCQKEQFLTGRVVHPFMGKTTRGKKHRGRDSTVLS